MKLPASEAKGIKPYILPKNANKILLLSDIHIPYHDEKAVLTAIAHGKAAGVNTIFLNGDIMDFYGASNFNPKPTMPSIRQEFEDTRAFLSELRKAFPDAHIYFKLGNHEIRWERYLVSKAPILFDMEEFRLDVIMRFAEYGIHLAGEPMGMAQAGKLYILHGHEFGRSVFSPVNPARGFYTRGKQSMIAGHHHRSSSHSEKDLAGKHVTTWSTGCLCELTPEYMPINNWNHGAALIDVLPSGNFKVDNFEIIDGEIV